MPLRLPIELAGIVGEQHVQAQAPLAPLTTFKAGGPADWLVTAQNGRELTAVLALATRDNIPVTILGGGSNLLVSDSGVRGIVLRIRGGEVRHTAAERIEADAAVTINGLVRWTISHALAGLELWAGTPGTVGGAVYGNAHFKGQNIGDLVTRAAVVTRDAEVRTLDGSELEFGYDTSRLQRTREVLLWAEFRVAPGESARLRDIARASLAYRKRTQPLHVPSAGCIFQNPDPTRDALPPGVPASAGALIDRAGLKGARVGAAEVSETHANFIVNRGGSSAADIKQLIEMCKAAVRERFGVNLKEEIVYLGDF